MPQDNAGPTLRPPADAVSHHLRGIDRTLRGAVVGAAILIACYALQDILLLGFAATLLDVVVASVIRKHTGIPYGWSLALYLVGLLAIVGGLLSWRTSALYRRWATRRAARERDRTDLVQSQP
ncbi:MAG TPA: hypothetical protein VHS58_15140 [Acetobacteraceae bacterium]|nr:hypothetical protein [Acetobacteraceae bacterium]